MRKHEHLISFVERQKPEDDNSADVITSIVWMEENFMPGAPYFEIMWFTGCREPRPPAHTHTFEEIIGFIGSDPNYPKDLGATVKFLIEDEWYTFTESVLIHIPAGLKHCPFVVENVERPFIHFSGGPNVKYTRTFLE